VRETTTEKQSLDNLFDENLNDTVNALAQTYYQAYRNNTHGRALISVEDLEGEGAMALTVAYRSYDPNKGKFSTWAYPYVRNAMQEYCLRFCHTLSISRQAARTELPKMLGVGVVHIDQLEEGSEFDIPAGSGMQSLDEARDYFFSSLGGFERKLMEDYLLNNLSLRQVAMRNQISASRAGKIIRKATDDIKVKVEEYVKND
jgi:RNA polymerase sigma factor (sigma-70 family)